MRNRLLIASLSGAALIALSWSAFAADTAQDFVNKAAVGGMFEVETSKLADDAAQDAAVKDFAHMMVTDHTAANTKLKAIAEKQKLTVPTALDEQHQAELDKLKDTKNASFDQPYVNMQRDAHKEAVSLFESYAKDGDNAALKAFAGETLPTLKMHQEKIETIGSGTATQPAASGTDDASGNDAKPPLPGANSFTEGQARDRIQDAGYSDVSALAKDDSGVWRGQARKDGKSVSVALDYKGNVTSASK
jgi:putative membrane protein